MWYSSPSYTPQYCAIAIPKLPTTSNVSPTVMSIRVVSWGRVVTQATTRATTIEMAEGPQSEEDERVHERQCPESLGRSEYQVVR
jgi:hypothetical protein